MNEDADMPRVDVRDRRGQEHEQHDERGRREQQPSHLRAETGGTIATHSTANRAEAIAEGALHHYLLDWLESALGRQPGLLGDGSTTLRRRGVRAVRCTTKNRSNLFPKLGCHSERSAAGTPCCHSERRRGIAIIPVESPS